MLTRPGGASGAFAAVRQLAGLSQDTCLAVLAAAAAGVRQLAEADEWEDVGSQAAHRLPQPHALAGWQEGDPSEFVWSLRNWTSRRGKQRSPAFAGPGGSQWQLQVGRLQGVQCRNTAWPAGVPASLPGPRARNTLSPHPLFPLPRARR